MTKHKLLDILLIVAVISLLFTFGDFLVHYLYKGLEVSYYSIPSPLLKISSSPLLWYVIGKFITTIILGFILLLFLINTNLKSYIKYYIFTSVIVIFLEVRYIISGYYSFFWHVLNIINHSIILFIVTFIVLKYQDF